MTLSAAILVRFVLTDSDVPANNDRRDLEKAIASAILEVDNIALINGSTTLTVPADAEYVVLEFLTGANSVTIEGVAGDTGIRLSTSAIPGPVCLPVVGGTTVMVLTSTGVGTARAYWL